MGNFVMTKRENGEFQFNLKAGNGQTILSSQGYASKASCESGIASVRTNSLEDSKFERMMSANGKPYFNLKATNGQIIGTSQMYESQASMENGIASVKTNASGATIDDLTV